VIARCPVSIATRVRSWTSCSTTRTGDPTRAPHRVAAAARVRRRSIGAAGVIASSGRGVPCGLVASGEIVPLTTFGDSGSPLGGTTCSNSRERSPAAAPSAWSNNSRSSASARPEAHRRAWHLCHHASASASIAEAFGVTLLGSWADRSTSRTYHWGAPLPRMPTEPRPGHPRDRQPRLTHLASL